MDDLAPVPSHPGRVLEPGPDGPAGWALPGPPTTGTAVGALFASSVLVVVVGALDVVSSPEITLSPLYLLAVIFGTWRAGRCVGFAVSVESALVGLTTDVLISEPYLQLEHSYTSIWVPVWNAAARILMYAAAVWAVSTLQGLLRERDARARELERALAEIRTLESLLPVCAWCGRIRDEGAGDEWKTLERYVAEHTDTSFTHGICPDCAARVTRDQGRRR